MSRIKSVLLSEELLLNMAQMHSIFMVLKNGILHGLVSPYQYELGEELRGKYPTFTKSVKKELARLIGINRTASWLTPSTLEK